MSNGTLSGSHRLTCDTMSLHNSGLKSTDLSDPPTQTHSFSVSEGGSDSDNESNVTDKESMKDLFHCTYLGGVYFPAPFLSDEVDYMSD